MNAGGHTSGVLFSVVGQPSAIPALRPDVIIEGLSGSRN